MKLKTGKYSYKSVRRTFFYKTGKKSLIITSFRDKVVQQALFRIMQFIYEGVSFWESVSYDTFKKFKGSSRSFYETDSIRIRYEKASKVFEIKKWVLNPIFDENSFGFRPNRSIHSALKLIKNTWSPVVWFWSVDLIKAFNDVYYNKLIYEIEKTIDDSMLMQELRKMFNIKIINFKITANDFSLIMLQSSVISAFLCNIYLTSLDKFVRDLKKKYDKVSSPI